ncbi:MAG: coproporphyrinogen III oxidase family protein [Woeseiaceae bacterium]
MIENLISRYVRHLNQRLMSFGSAPGEIQLPDPESGKHYLLYLHIPFCVVLCPFCSFHRVEFRQDRATQYFDALQQEIRSVSERGYRFGELYVGGGTPTVMPEALAETIELVSEEHPISTISIETNPHDLDAHKLRRLHNAGVKRLSVGVQSFDDELLKEMQRYEKYGSGDEIRDHLQSVGDMFDTLNVDMIFNFPHQTEAILEADLDILTSSLSVDQVSWYPLMTTASTSRPMARQIGQVDHSRERRFYEIIVCHMLAAGYKRSSAWCFSRRPGMFDEYIVEQEEYVGLGSGSFSYVDGSMYANTFSINNYLRLVSEGHPGTVQKRGLTSVEQMRYFLLMRMFGGQLDLDVAERRFAGQFGRVMWSDLAGLRAIGAIRKNSNELRLTEFGYYLWVILMREFFSGVNNFRDDMRHNISREPHRV